MLIYLFRDEGTDNLALTIDVAGGNLPPVTPSTDWIFLEAIDTLRSSPPWDVADFQRLHRWLRVDGFYLFGAAYCLIGNARALCCTKWVGGCSLT